MSETRQLSASSTRGLEKLIDEIGAVEVPLSRKVYTETDVSFLCSTGNYESTTVNARILGADPYSERQLQIDGYSTSNHDISALHVEVTWHSPNSYSLSCVIVAPGNTEIHLNSGPDGSGQRSASVRGQMIEFGKLDHSYAKRFAQSLLEPSTAWEIVCQELKGN